MKTAGNNRKTTSNRVALYGLLIALAFVWSLPPGVKSVAPTGNSLAFVESYVNETCIPCLSSIPGMGSSFAVSWWVSQSGNSHCPVWTKTFGYFSYSP